MSTLEKATRSRSNITIPPTRAEHLEAARRGITLTGEALAQLRAEKVHPCSKPAPATVESTAKTLAALEGTVTALNDRVKQIEASLYRHKLTGLLR